jgi:hypothetical protein
LQQLPWREVTFVRSDIQRLAHTYPDRVSAQAPAETLR